jgi:glutamate-1-semialdehyde 2,1-aminomutase
MPNRTASREIFQDSCGIIPGGVNSPPRAFPGLDMTPLIAARGQGAVVWDADNHCYIDYCCSWGALVLGHCHHTVFDTDPSLDPVGHAVRLLVIS